MVAAPIGIAGLRYPVIGIRWTPRRRSQPVESGTPGHWPRLGKNDSARLGAAVDDRAAALLSFWHRNAAAGAGGLPDRQAFDPLNLAPWLGYLSVYEHDAGRDDFLNRLEGTYVADLTGENWTGRFASDVDRRFGSRFGEELAAVRRSRQPATDLVQIFQNDFGVAVRLMMPVAKVGSSRADQIFVAIFAKDYHPSLLI